MQVIRFLHHDKANMQAALEVRTEVFVREQGIDPALEYDEYDDQSQHYLCFVEDHLAGTGRLRETDQGFKLERYAVLKPYRKRGVGAAILQQMLKDLIPLGKTIYLHAQLSALAFYEKHGFVKEGAVFYEAGIGHYKMTYPKPLPGKD